MDVSRIEKYAHIFKSKSVNSERLRKITTDSIVSSDHLTKKARARARKKQNKLDSIKIEPVLQSTFTWDGKQTIYFDGCGSGLLGQVDADAKIVDPRSASNVVDSTCGALLENVFCLLPSRDTEGICQSKTYEALHELERKTKPKTTARGVKRLPKGGAKYVVVGTKASRNSPGLLDGVTSLERLPWAHKEISRLLVAMERAAAMYIPTLDLKALAVAKQLGQYPGFLLAGEKASESSIWPSIAYGRNVFLPLHRDDDYFLSACVIFTNKKTTDEVLGYFCFPTEGISVAMRNGNVVIFNPKIPHCLSSPCKPSLEAFCLSAYVKSLVVSGNSNKPL